jgi:hypothetical protein
VKRILPLFLGAAALLIAGDPAAPPASSPAAVPAAAPAVTLPGFHPAAGRYELHITGSNGSRVDLSAIGPVDPEKLKLFETEIRKEVERSINFDIQWAETVTPAEAGGVTLTRVIRSAKVERLIGGQPETGPLPIDYEDAVLEISLDAGGRMTRRKFTAPRLAAEEKEILEQFLEVEPFPELPASIAPGERVERVSTQLIPSETRDEPTPQVTTDHYQLAPAAERAAEKMSPASGAALRLDRESLIEGAGGTLNPIRTQGKFWITLAPTGLVSDCHGNYEQSYSETIAAPPELLLAQPEPTSAPSPTSAHASAPAAASAASSPASSAAAPGVRVVPVPEGKVLWAYHLPGSFTLNRKPLPAVATAAASSSATAPGAPPQASTPGPVPASGSTPDAPPAAAAVPPAIAPESAPAAAGAGSIPAPSIPAPPKNKPPSGKTKAHGKKAIRPPPGAASPPAPARSAP